VTFSGTGSRLAYRRAIGRVFVALCITATLVGMITLAVLIISVASDGLGRVSWDFVNSFPSRFPEQAGIKAALYGTIWVMAFTALFAIPIGIGAAIYLEEFAPRNWFTKIVETNINNLAGVPSIIYGILGLAVFVRLLHLGPTVLAAALTLTLLILPIVIIASIEAIKAVPNAQREGAYALGATRWQMVRRSVFPAAAPGIMTGIILAMARAIGEAAPLILIGGVGFVTFLPSPVAGAYTVLPLQIFDWAKRPQADFASLSSAAIIVILVLMLLLNGLALIVRARLSRHIQW
jgi:phosphate transport system permease protein